MTARSGGVSLPLWSADARPAGARGRVAAALRPYRTAILVYAGTRVLLLAVAIVGGALRGHGVAGELGHWDGVWYRAVAEHGYARHVLHVQSTLGFFPLYPMVVWPFAHVLAWLSAHSFAWSTVYAGVAVSTVGGLVATVLAQKLATGWWDEASGSRAALLFCLFPGSVVFSMVYAEGILIPLAIATILALERRRWLLAGILAGLATATEPEALILVLVCAVSAVRELRRRGWNDPAALAEPARARPVRGRCRRLRGVPVGVDRQSVRQPRRAARRVAREDRPAGTGAPGPDVGLGDVLLTLQPSDDQPQCGRRTPRRRRPDHHARAGLEVAARDIDRSDRVDPGHQFPGRHVGLSVLAEPTRLDHRLPALLVVGHYVSGRWWVVLAWANGISLAGLSLLTFVGTTLRP